MNFFTGACYTRSVGKCQFILISDFLGWSNTDFSRNGETMESECIFFKQLFFLILRIHLFCLLKLKGHVEQASFYQMNN